MSATVTILVARSVLSIGDEIFPPLLESTPAVKMPSAIIRPVSHTPSFGGHCCTGLNTPGQQCPPNEGVWETGRIIADGILTAGVDSSKGGNISSPMESTERATMMVTVADIPLTAATPPKRRHKTSSEENKQFDPGGRGEQAPPWKAAVPLPFFSWSDAGRLLVCLSGAELRGFFYVPSMLCFFLFSQIIDLSR